MTIKALKIMNEVLLILCTSLLSNEVRRKKTDKMTDDNQHKKMKMSIFYWIKIILTKNNFVQKFH